MRPASGGRNGRRSERAVHLDRRLHLVSMAVRNHFADQSPLAGHAHGGQIRLGSSLVPFLPPGSGRFVSGWYHLPMGAVYVSRGTGTSIVPARFACRPELPIYRLREA
jgi:hypothetical protein